MCATAAAKKCRGFRVAGRGAIPAAAAGAGKSMDETRNSKG
jgi:hypothetical protein